jgi:hypothetical protein
VRISASPFHAEILLASASNKTQKLLSDVSCDRNRFKVVMEKLGDRTVGRFVLPCLPALYVAERFEKVD